MHPSQFKRLLALLQSSFELLRSGLREIREAANDQKHAVSLAAQAAEADQREKPGIVFRIVSAIESTNKDVPAYEKSQRDKEYRQQNRLVWAAWFTFGATTAAFIAAGIYACIAKNQLKESERQTHLSCINTQILERGFADSHKASIAAYAQAMVALQGQKTFVEADFSLPGNRPYGKPLLALVRVKNSGKSDASNIRFTGWALMGKPNSGATEFRPPNSKSFSIQAAYLRVGSQILPESTGTTKEGNPHGMYVPVYDSAGNQVIDTAEIDQDIRTNKQMIYGFYAIHYEDFTARYSRHVCDFQLFYGENNTLGASISDKGCSSYNTQEEEQKIPLLSPSKAASTDDLALEIKCPIPND